MKPSSHDDSLESENYLEPNNKDDLKKSQRSVNRDVKNLRKELAKANELLELGKVIGSEIQLATLISLIAKVTSKLLAADRTSIFLLDRRTNELWSYVAQGMRKHQEIRFSAETGVAGHVAMTGEILNIPDAYKDPRFNQNIDKQTGYRTKTILCMPMKNRTGTIVGVVQVINKFRGFFNQEDIGFLESLASMSGISLENAWLYLELENLFNSFIDTSSMAIETRDPCTAGHSRRVASYTMKLAEILANQEGPPYLGRVLEKDDLRQLRYAALLHDFGKIGVREHILNKSARLSEDRMMALKSRFQLAAFTADNEDKKKWLLDSYKWLETVNTAGFLPDESIDRIKDISEHSYADYFGTSHPLLDRWELENLLVRKGNLTDDELRDMQSHVQLSFDMLRLIPWPAGLGRVPEILYQHHEKINGKGYPRLLKGDQLVLESRILAVCDIYDALTARDRPYKPAIPHDKSVEILRNMAKFQELDTYLVELFIEKGGWKIEENNPESIPV